MKPLRNEIDLSVYTFGKIPPQSRDLEEAVLGACMLESDKVHEAIMILKPEHFYLTAHTHIFSAVVRIYSRNEPVDILTVVEDLKKHGLLDDVGGAYYVTGLCERVASAGNIESHARIIKQKWVQRELIKLNSVAMKESYEDTADVFETLGNCMSEFSKLLNEISSGSTKIFSEVVDETFKGIAVAASKSEDEKYVIGHTTGIADLDRKTLGYNNSDFILIAGRPKDGKTTIAVVSALANGKKGVPCGFISLEMSKNQLVMKMAALETGIEIERIRAGRINKLEWGLLDQAQDTIRQMPIFINDRGGVQLHEIEAMAKGWQAKHGIELLFVDYLQLIRFDVRGGNREQGVSEISRAMKALAKNINIPIIAVSSLSRALENRSGWEKRPKDSDLREGGSLEYDPDMIIFVFRPENHDLTEHEGAATHKMIELIVSKNRLGSLGIIRQSIDDGSGRLSQFQERFHSKEKQSYYEVESTPFD